MEKKTFHSLMGKEDKIYKYGRKHRKSHPMKLSFKMQYSSSKDEPEV